MAFAMMPSPPPVVDVTELTRTFGAIMAVDHVTFSIGEGEIFGVIGPNGAGKSSLIKMLTTLLPTTSGSARIAGHDVVSEPQRVREHIGYVPQLLSADGSLTGYENMLVSARLYAIGRRQRGPRIAEALATMGLTDVADHLVSHYSGGMIRRLEIAQSMMHRPAVLFMDEPTVGLDPTARELVWDLVLELRSRLRTTMLVTSHYMEEVEELCDRIALMVHGRIVTIGTASELKAQVGPDATLDDVFSRLTRGSVETEAERSYGEVRRARRAARQHG